MVERKPPQSPGHPWRDDDPDKTLEPMKPLEETTPIPKPPSLSDLADGLIDQIRGDRQRRSEWKRRH